MPFCLQLRKKCLSSSHETGLAIAVHYTNNVVRVSRATQSAYSCQRAILYVSVQVDGFVTGKQQDPGEAN